MPTKKKSRSEKVRQKPPELYVKVIVETHGNWYVRHDYARAHVRVKSGKYQYLQWRDGNKVRSLYLGQNRGKIRIS